MAAAWDLDLLDGHGGRRGERCDVIGCAIGTTSVPCSHFSNFAVLMVSTRGGRWGGGGQAEAATATHGSPGRESKLPRGQPGRWAHAGPAARGPGGGAGREGGLGLPAPLLVSGCSA